MRWPRSRRCSRFPFEGAQRAGLADRASDRPPRPARRRERRHREHAASGRGRDRGRVRHRMRPPDQRRRGALRLSRRYARSADRRQGRVDRDERRGDPKGADCATRRREPPRPAIATPFIPTFAEFLALVAGRTPIICELKSRFDGDWRIADRATAVAASYEGPLASRASTPTSSPICACARHGSGLPGTPLPDRRSWRRRPMTIPTGTL